MTTPPAPLSHAYEMGMDVASLVLFVVFLAFLYLGFIGLYPSVPFSALGAIALFGSLVVLFGANWRVDRSRSPPLVT